MGAKKIPLKFEDGKMIVGLDTDGDGKNSVSAVVHLTEGMSEIFAKGGKIEGMKKVSMEFKDGKFVVKIDTDQDGEESFSFAADLMESLDEISQAVKKD